MSCDPGPVPTSAPPSASDLALARFIAAVPAWLAEPSCCCPSRPAFRVLLQPPDADVPVDLLFCAHHFRISRARLARLGGRAYDDQDVLLTPDAWRLGGSQP